MNLLNNMKKQFYVIIVLITVILMAAFYWYAYRPEQIRKNCYKRVRGFYISASQEAMSGKSVEEIQGDHYLDCLMSFGLK